MKTYLLITILFITHYGFSQQIDSLERKYPWIYVSKIQNRDVLGKKLPDFKACDLNLKIYSNDGIYGAATFLNFWFESCKPCIEEIPELNRLYEYFKDDHKVRFFGLTFDSKESAAKAVKKYNIKYPVLIVTRETAQMLTYGRGYPTSMILDSLGSIRFFVTGGASVSESYLVDDYFKPEIWKLLKN